MTTRRRTRAAALAAALLLVPALARSARGDDGVRSALREGRARDAAARAIGHTEEFSDALHDVLRASDASAADRRAVAVAALDTSPLLAVRTFSDGREATGWDVAYSVVLADDGSSSAGLAEALRAVERSLSPEVWHVEESLEHLGRVAALEPADPRVADVVFRTADRLAPFDAHRADAAKLVAGVLGHDLPRAVRHRYLLAALRLRAADRAAPWSARDAALWEGAESTAPSRLAAEVVHIAAARERVLRGAGAADMDVLDALRLWSVAKGRSSDARRLALPWIARRHAQRGRLPEALAALTDLAVVRADDPRLLAAARCDVVGSLADRGTTLDDAAAARLVAILANSAERLGRTNDAVIVDVALARVRTMAGDAAGALRHLRAASALARAGAPVRPPRIPRSEWWRAVEPPVDADLRPVETSRSACWELADRAFNAGNWDLALEYLGVDPPGEGCGNVYDDARALQLTRRAVSLERLGRTADARATLRAFVREAVSWRSSSLAVVKLIDFERAHDALSEHEHWMSAAALPAETLAKGVEYGELRRALDDGRSDDAAAAAARIAQQWPEDVVLKDRVRALTPARDDSDGGDGRGGSPPR